MNSQQLLEARITPDWVKSEDRFLKQLLHRYDLTCAKRPTRVGVYTTFRWIFGGQLVDTDTQAINIKLETRIRGLQRAIAKHLFELHKQGKEVVICKAITKPFNREPIVIAWDYIYFYKDDTLAHVEALVSDRLFVNHHGTGGYDIMFYYGIEEPKEPAPKPAPAPPKKRSVFEEADDRWREKARVEFNALIKRFGANSREKSVLSPWQPDIVLFRRQITINTSESPLIFPTARRYEGLIAAIARWLRTFADAGYIVHVYDDDFVFPGMHQVIPAGSSSEEAREVVRRRVSLISPASITKDTGQIVFTIGFAIIRHQS